MHFLPENMLAWGVFVLIKIAKITLVHRKISSFRHDEIKVVFT